MTHKATKSPAHGLTKIHLLLSVQSLVVVLVSINRLSSLTLGYVAQNQFLRWVDFNNMLILPLASVVAFYLLKKQVEYHSQVFEGRAHMALNLSFIVGVYLLAVSYGNHEVTNYLNARFCGNADSGDLCRIIIFNDDTFSHWLFFAGFVLINAALMFLQVVFPHVEKVSRGNAALLIINGLFIGVGIFANLAFEEIGLDLYVIALLAALAFILLWRRGAEPLFIYYAAAYGIGLAATFLYTTFL
ncbi:MAG: hypothetical protein R3293_08520 [Candidatus Promineifilaceae bacterium]|nr:hypothetical protein [Candidatus Promineifilaceae bacterium]